VGPIAFLSAIAFWPAVSLSSLVLGLVFLWFAPRAADAALVAARAGAWEALAIGLAVAIVLPIAGVVALVTLVGIPLGVALGLALAPLYALAYVTGAWLLGRAVVREPRGRVPAFLAGWESCASSRSSRSSARLRGSVRWCSASARWWSVPGERAKA